MTPEQEQELDELAAKAIEALERREREGYDIKEWAERLTRDVIDADD